MPFTYIFDHLAPVTWKQWVLSVGTGFLALCLLRYHVYYLSHLNVDDWSWRYLQVNRLNTDFTHKMRRAKIVVCVLWMAALAFSWRYSKVLLRENRIEPYLPATRRMGLALAVFLFTVVNYDPPDVELSFYFFINSVSYAGLIFALYRLPYTRLPLSLLGKLVLRVKNIPTSALACGVALFILSVSWRVGAEFFSHLPLTVDTSAQLVHAKMLATGHWTLPSQPLKDFFNMYMMINDGKWYSQYPPGHVILLAIGTFFKMRTYVNPCLGACTSLAIFALAKELYGIRVARYAVVLSGGCVYLIMMSSEFMSNATSLLTGTLFLWAYFRMLKKPHWKCGLWGGLALGYCFITRPYTVLALAAPYVLYSVYLLIAKRQIFLRSLLAMAGGGMCFVLFQLYYNKITTGNAFTYGYQLSWGNWHNPFTPEAADKLSGWELVKNFRENMQRTGWFNRLTFEWPVPNLLLLALVYGWRGHRRDEKLLFVTLFSFLASCAVLPGNVEREWGPRLCYETLSIILVLSAKALSVLPAFFRLVCKQRRSLAYYYGFAAIIAVAFYGFSAAHNLKQGTLASIYNFYDRGTNPSFYTYVVHHVETPALVFVTGQTYQAVSFTNPPTENSPIIFADDLDRDAKQLVRFYPGRNAYHASIGRFGYSVEPIRMALGQKPPTDTPQLLKSDENNTTPTSSDIPEGEQPQDQSTTGHDRPPADRVKKNP